VAFDRLVRTILSFTGPLTCSWSGWIAVSSVYGAVEQPGTSAISKSERRVTLCSPMVEWRKFRGPLRQSGRSSAVLHCDGHWRVRAQDEPARRRDGTAVAFPFQFQVKIDSYSGRYWKGLRLLYESDNAEDAKLIG
jgi:hypothetical protein